MIPAAGPFFVVMVIDPNQTSPAYIGAYAVRRDAEKVADDLVSKDPRRRAVILKGIDHISATASVKSIDPETGEERKRSVEPQA
ncbi:MAG: hypothetical protein E8D43_00885 [Nitrospira sp.]|nr:MAG: hypothetical protein E8D43_00885 [Nitrospira sp.]